MTQTTTNSFNPGHAVQIGAGMGMVMMLAGIHLIDALILGAATGLAVFGIVAVVRMFRNTERQ